MIKYEIIQVNTHHKVVYANVNYKAKEELFSILKNHVVQLDKLQQIKNERRQIEWMSIRVLLIKHLEGFCDIHYNEHHKPFLKNCSQHLSLSHSHHKVAISIDEKANTGIDIQHVTDKIMNIKKKFLNEEELQRSNTNSALELTLYWSIKEALFKVYGKNDIFLKGNILVEELQFNGKNGTAKGSIIAPNYSSQHFLELKLIDNYVLAYVVN